MRRTPQLGCPPIHCLYISTPGPARPKNLLVVLPPSYSACLHPGLPSSLPPALCLCIAPFTLLHPGWLRSTGRFGWVGTNCESHSREQLCVGVCQRPAMRARRAAELPPTSLLQPVLFVWLFSGCNLDVSVSWGIRTPRRWTDTLCVTLEDFFLTVMTAELCIEYLLWNILAPEEQATIALLMTFSTVDDFFYRWWHLSTYARKYGTSFPFYSSRCNNTDV